MNHTNLGNKNATITICAIPICTITICTIPICNNNNMHNTNIQNSFLRAANFNFLNEFVCLIGHLRFTLYRIN